MSTADLSLLHQALDLLEEREAELLVWGDTDGAFTHADIISLFTRHLPYEDAESLLAELQKAAMLFSVPTSKGGTRYRTRMAEAVCLFRHQRQWFRNQPLQQARTLVADYRFVRRPRNYPKRELPAQTVLSKWVDVPWMNEIKRQALSRLIGDFFIA
ncbi:hypothetical protein AB2F06_01065 [Escherichia coli]